MDGVQWSMYVWSMLLSKCCFHHLVENSILYNKDIQHFYCIGSIIFSENKIICSVVGRKVDGQIFGARIEKPKIVFVLGVKNGKFIWCQMTVTTKFILQSKG